MLVTTGLLSQKTSAGQSIGTPDIRSLYLNPSIISVAIRNAMNLEPLFVGIVVFVPISVLLYSPDIHPTCIVPAVCAS